VGTTALVKDSLDGDRLGKGSLRRQGYDRALRERKGRFFTIVVQEGFLGVGRDGGDPGSKRVGWMKMGAR